MGRKRIYENRQIFFKNYIANSPIIICSTCDAKFKKCYKSIHNKSNHHKNINEFINNFNDLDNLLYI
jgi:hypothetical protein